MAGKRHHINPRFLLKGFVSPTHRNKKLTWAFRHGMEPFKTNIGNVGVESNFYRHDNSLEADSAITEIEPIFANLLDKIRAGEEAALFSPHLPEMIAHFEIRTKHLRNYLSQTAELAITSASNFLSDDNKLANELKSMVRRNSPLLQEAIQDSLEEHNLPQEMLQPILMLATRFGPGLIDQQQHLLQNFVGYAPSLLEEYTEKTEEIVQSSHIKSIQRSPVPEARADSYKHLTYSIVKKPDGMILGDSLVLFRINSERRYKATLDADDEMIAVYLPIDSETVLVGANQHENTLPSDFVEAVAHCSLEYFVASENTETNRKLQRQIGANAILFTAEEKKKLVGEARSEEQHNHEIIAIPVYNYCIDTASPKEEPGMSAILLVLQTKWGYQGFALNKAMAQDLLQDLYALVPKNHSGNKRT